MARNSPHIHRGGYRFRKARAQMFITYGDVCIHCGHAGSREADHIVPLSIDPDQPIDPDLMRPAHGSQYPCHTCGRRCNQERGNKIGFTMFKPSLTW